MVKPALIDEEKNVIQSVSRKGVVSMMVYVIYKVATFMLMAYNGELEWWMIAIFCIDIFAIFLIPLFSVQKPEMKKLFITIRKALSDGKITPEEGLAIIRQTWLVVLGFWADYSQTEIEINEKKPLEPIP